MAYKTFANGFPLPASDLNNFLMNQSVIVFADSAARGTAIPSPVQGMLTYLVDTSAYESWNGSAFVSISNPGDITAVTAGTGLTGGGTSGDVTLNLDTSAVIPSSTVTTAQDLIVADGASSVTRLGVGTDDQVLSVVAGSVAWADAGGGSYTLISSATASGASVTFSAIPSTYQDLVIVGDSIDLVGTENSITIQDNYGYLFVFARLEINGTTASLVADTTNSVIGTNSSGAGVSDFTAFIYNYKETMKRGVKVYGIGSRFNRPNFLNGLITHSTAISSLQINAGGSTFTGGTFRLYGVK